MSENHYDEKYFEKHNTFEKLTVKSLGPSVKVGHNRYKRFCHCVCECGIEKDVERFNLIRGLTKSCGCDRYKKGNRSKSWGGVGDLHKTTFCAIRSDARRRRLPFSITMEYLWDLFLKQNKQCALSGESLCFRSKSRAFDGTASLDRIDSIKGYVEGNVQWLHKDVNFMKHTIDQTRFIELCNKITEYTKNTSPQ